MIYRANSEAHAVFLGRAKWPIERARPAMTHDPIARAIVAGRVHMAEHGHEHDIRRARDLGHLRGVAHDSAGATYAPTAAGEIVTRRIRYFLRLPPQATPEAAIDLGGGVHAPRLHALASEPGHVVGSVEITGLRVQP